MWFKGGIFLMAVLMGCYASLDFKDHRKTSSRIVGGTIASRVPHMVALISGVIIRSFDCGASLITTKHVLTAAHCVRISRAGTLQPSLRGVLGTNYWRTNGTQIAFSHGIIHPEYSHQTLHNDIAILVSTATVPLSDRIQLVTLNYDWVDGGVPATVSGWGVTEEDRFSKVLLTLETKVISGEQCQVEIDRLAIEDNTDSFVLESDIEFCTLSPVGKGVCSGDSGSPLLRSDNNEQIGVVSWGYPCGRGAPDGYVRVSAYKNWIEQNIL